MNKRIGIIDYGVSNLLSIQRAIEKYKYQVDIVNEPLMLSLYDSLILPGVGAYKDGMQGLRSLGLVEAIKEYASTSRPILGICLGMQMLFEESEEFGLTQGLGLIGGKVKKLPELTVDKEHQRVPHIGWSNVVVQENELFSKSLAQSEYYFCHSYAVVPASTTNIIASYNYGGHSVVAAVKVNNIYGFQFHPEKSGEAGLSLIKNFLLINGN